MPTIAWSGREDVSKKIKEKLANILIETIHFALRGIAPDDCQFVISLPKRGCVVSQSSIRGDEREKQAVASTRKTMPGISGMTNAMTPIRRLRQPSAKYIGRCQRELKGLLGSKLYSPPFVTRSAMQPARQSMSVYQLFQWVRKVR